MPEVTSTSKQRQVMNIDTDTDCAISQAKREVRRPNTNQRGSMGPRNYVKALSCISSTNQLLSVLCWRSLLIYIIRHGTDSPQSILFVSFTVFDDLKQVIIINNHLRTLLTIGKMFLCRIFQDSQGFSL